jgi:hypothetical protein
MTLRTSYFTGFCIATAMLWSAPAFATSVYDYAPDEYAFVSTGKAPDGRHAIAAHGEGEGGAENFHLYLMSEPDHKKIGVLEEVKDVLDSAPDAFGAAWSADSHYVALEYRIDRHVAELTMYRIEEARAFAVKVPDLLKSVLASAAPKHAELDIRARHLAVTWIGPKRFKLTEQGTLRSNIPAVIEKAVKYGDAAPDDRPGIEDKGAKFIGYAIEAECTIVQDACQPSAIKRGPGNTEP